MIFGMLNPEKILHEKILHICPSYLSDVVIFSSIIHTYFWLFTLSQKNNNNNNDRLTAFDPGQPG